MSGLSLRARQAWDFRQLCSQDGRRLALTVDLRQPGTWERLQKAMAAFRPDGALGSGKVRPASTGDYQPWIPE